MWRVSQNQTGMSYDSRETLHDIVFIERYACTQLVTQCHEKRIFHRNEPPSCFTMTLHLCLAELCYKTLCNVGGTDNLNAKGSYQFERAAIATCHVGDGVHGGVFHCYTRTGSHHTPQLAFH